MARLLSPGVPSRRNRHVPCTRVLIPPLGRLSGSPNTLFLSASSTAFLHERDTCLSFISSTPLNEKCRMLSFRKDTYNLVTNLQVVQNWCVKKIIKIKASSLGFTWLGVALTPRSRVQTAWMKWQVSLFNLDLHKQMKLLTAEIIQSTQPVPQNELRLSMKMFSYTHWLTIFLKITLYDCNFKYVISSPCYNLVDCHYMNYQKDPPKI